MSGDVPKAYFGISCPNGGSFYVCKGEQTEFVGCCKSDPCANDGICADGDVEFTSFSADMYDKLNPQGCDNSGSLEGDWYTCKFTSPPFMGCCSENPCDQNSGCPDKSLVPAVLSTVTKNRDGFLSPNGTTSGPSESETSSSGNSNNDGGLSTGAVAGIAAGAAVGGLLVLALLVWRLWLVPRKKKREEQAQQQQMAPPMSQPTSPAPGYPQTPMTHHQSSFSTSPTPVYPSGVSSDAYNKLSPYASDRPISTNFSDVSSVYGRPPYNQGYSPVPMVPVQEMDGTTAVPQELSTGQEHSIPLDRTQSPQGPNPGHQNQLGINS